VALTFEEARACVIANARRGSEAEPAELSAASGRVIAEDIVADRDYSPFARSARDGFAVRAADVPSELKIIGEVRAGQVFNGTVGAGQAVEIMTGAPMPYGADAVVMVEHAERLPVEQGDRLKIAGALKAGDNFSPKGVEARAGAVVLEAGRRLGFAEIALLAMVAPR
jgi:molybdopterin molybdotransferase